MISKYMPFYPLKVVLGLLFGGFITLALLEAYPNLLIEIWNALLGFPIKVYDNALACKDLIRTENKGMSGIYLFENNLTGETYIGSASDLASRLSYYFSTSALMNAKGISLIYGAILYSGLNIFSLQVLCYYKNKQILTIFEQAFIHALQPVYNILKIAGSPLGFKHSPETKDKMSAAKKGESNPMFGKKGENSPVFGKSHNNPKSLANLPAAISVTVIYTLNNNEKITYPSISSAAKAIGCAPNTLMRNERKYGSSFL
jgi:group I intron endonuclease